MKLLQSLGLLLVFGLVFFALPAFGRRRHGHPGSKHRGINRKGPPGHRAQARHNARVPYGPPGSAYINMAPIDNGPPSWNAGNQVLSGLIGPPGSNKVHDMRAALRYYDNRILNILSKIVGPPAPAGPPGSRLAPLTAALLDGRPAHMVVRPPGVKMSSPLKMMDPSQYSGALKAGPPAFMDTARPGAQNSPKHMDMIMVGRPSLVGPPSGPRSSNLNIGPGCPPGEFSSINGCQPMAEALQVACPPGTKRGPMGLKCNQENAVLDEATYMRQVHGHSDPMGPNAKNQPFASPIIGPPATKK